MNIILYVGRLCGGGAEKVASMWATGFFQKGDRVKIIVNSRFPNEYWVPEKIEIEEVKRASLIKILGQIKQIINLRRMIKQFNPDVVITVMHPCGLYAYLATVGLDIPIVNTEHNAFERPGKAKWGRFELFNKFYVNKLFKHVTVLAQADKDLIGNRLKHVTVLPNPLSFKPVIQVPPKEKVVLAMGRLDAWYIKGFDVLIKAWGIIHEKHPDWRLQIAGAGSEKAKAQLMSFCEESNVVGNVDFIGFFYNPVEAYKSSSIFVLSSRCEGFGMVIVEAMSQGCACVACDYGGRQKEIIRNDKEGVVCKADNVDELSSSIISLIENETQRKEIQRVSVQRSYDYELEIIMDKWNLIFENINNSK